MFLHDILGYPEFELSRVQIFKMIIFWQRITVMFCQSFSLIGPDRIHKQVIKLGNICVLWELGLDPSMGRLVAGPAIGMGGVLRCLGLGNFI